MTAQSVPIAASAWICAVLLATAGCGPTGSGPAHDGRIEVFVGLPSYASLAERIGGEHIVVHVLLQPGQDPHTFGMTPKQMQAVGRAHLFFKAGMPFEERFVERIGQEHVRLRVVDVAACIEKRPMEEACCPQESGAEEDGHGHAHEGHGHGGPDPHVWFSPPLLKTQAANMALALEEADPAHAAEYRQNLAALTRDLDALDTKITALLKPYRGRAFYVFHPGFGYFADAYGLKQVAIEAGGRTPTPKQLRELMQQAQADRVTAIYVQPEFDDRNAQTIAEALGAKVVTIDPLAKDVLSALDDAAMKIAEGFRAGP